jgi:hypothetical protein
MPQPNFVPVNPKTSRTYHNKGMLESPSNVRSIPFTFSFTIRISPLSFISEAFYVPRQTETQLNVKPSSPSVWIRYEEEFPFDGVSLSTRLLSGGHQGPARTGILLEKHGREGWRGTCFYSGAADASPILDRNGQVAGGES